MSILINMEMPKRCEDCPVCYKYETVTAIACGCKINMRTREIGCVTRPDWCPITEVPPHGRLIDVDAFERNLIPMQNARNQNNLVARGIRKARGVARDLPTIIPADKGGET